MPSSRVSTAARCASGVEVSAFTRARSSRTRRATTWYAVRPLGPTLPRCAAASTCRTVLARTGMMPSSSPARGRRRSRGVVRGAPARRSRRGARCAKRFHLLSRTRRGAEVGIGSTVPEATRPSRREHGIPTTANARPGPSPGPRVAGASSPNDGTPDKPTCSVTSMDAASGGSSTQPRDDQFSARDVAPRVATSSPNTVGSLSTAAQVPSKPPRRNGRPRPENQMRDRNWSPSLDPYSAARRRGPASSELR
jgi:hypothetical protein